MRTASFVLLIALACAGATCRHTTDVRYHGLYLSLGDSVAAGNGSTDRTATSYAALLAHDEGVELRNVAVAGATTQDVIDRQIPPLVQSVGTQKVAFITISTGGNDLAALIPNTTCQVDPLPATCPLDEALRKVEANVDTILQRLRAAWPDATIVLLAYPNFFSGTGHAFEAPAARVLPRLDDSLRTVAARYPRTATAEAAPAFEGRGPELTHVLDPQFDPHPNDAGHRIIADAFIAALISEARANSSAADR